MYGRTDDTVEGWAKAREAEGWHGLGVPDHIVSSGVGWPRPFFLLGVLTAATSRSIVTAAVANNLLRSPAEFAQRELQQAA